MKKWITLTIIVLFALMAHAQQYGLQVVKVGKRTYTILPSQTVMLAFSKDDKQTRLQRTRIVSVSESTISYVHWAKKNDIHEVTPDEIAGMGIKLRNNIITAIILAPSRIRPSRYRFLQLKEGVWELNIVELTPEDLKNPKRSTAIVRKI